MPINGIIGGTRLPDGSASSLSGIHTVSDVYTWNRRRVWPGSVSLLDTVTGAAAAYSLRNLFAKATTNVVRVRRSTDNTEQDFSGVQIIDGSLAAFCGAGDGFVRTWYDQSGNGRNAGQATTSLQPQIVSSGSVITLNGKPAIDWVSGTADKVLTTTISTTTSTSVSAVFSAVRRDGGYAKLYNIGPDNQYTGHAFVPIAGVTAQDWSNTEAIFLTAGFDATQGSKIIATNGPITSNVTIQNKVFASVSRVFARMDVNSVEVSYNKRIAADGFPLTSTTLFIGNNNNSVQQFIGRMQEIVIWTTDKYANRVDVISDLNNYYGA